MAGQGLRPGPAGAHRPRAHADAGAHQRAFRPLPAHRPVQLHAPQHRNLGRPDQGAEVQRVHPQPGGADQPQPGHRSSRCAARRCWCSIPTWSSWSSTTCSAATAASTPGSKAATSRQPSSASSRACSTSSSPNTRRPGSRSIEIKFEYVRSEMNTQFANIATPSEIVVVDHLHASNCRGNSAEMHFCLPYSMVEPIRDVLYSTMHSEQAGSDKRWTSMLDPAVADWPKSNWWHRLPPATVTLGDIVEHEGGRRHADRHRRQHPGRGRWRAGHGVPLWHPQRPICT